MSNLDKRRGFSISVKMILTTIVLISIIIAGFAALDIWSIGRVFDNNVADKERLIAEQMHKVGTATVAALASSSRTFLETNNDPDLKHYVADLAKRDSAIAAVYVVDANGGLIAHSDESKNQEGHPKVTEDGWILASKMWKQRSDAKELDPLISTDLQVNQVRRALFALPVFPAGAPATATGIYDQNEANKPLGFVIVEYGYGELDRAIAIAKQQKEAAYRDVYTRTAGVGLIFVLIGTLLAILQGLRISKPLKMLAWRADQIARGDLDSRVEVTSADEIGLLGENFNYMADQLVVLLRQTAEKATLEKELEVARTIQETLVPPNDTIDRGFVQISGYFQPASQCGGDWWTYHDLANGKVLVVIGDVTGHGVPSAMITAAAKAACDVARAVTGDDVSCTQLLEIMNRAIFESAKRKFVMTCFASILDPRSRTITYANAGHNFPYLYRIGPDGKGEFGSLMTRGNRLGDLADSRYTSKTTELLPGDVLVWYTDGIVECENEAGEEFGEKRFRSAIRKAAVLDPAEMRETVVGASLQFFGERPRKDDITMVFARVYG